MIPTIAIIVASALVLTLVVGNLLTGVFQAGFIFKPTRLRETHEYIFMEEFKEMTLPGAQGGTLNALLFPSAKTESKGLVIYFPPNHGNIERWGEANTIFTQGGYDFLVFDHYGFGKSKGQMTEANFYENARLVYRELTKRYKPENIILFGKGLGAAVAGKLATEVQVKRMIMETPFASVRDLFYSYYNWIPRLLAFKYKFPLYQFVQEISCPIIILHGTKDTLVPFSNTLKLQPLLKHSDEVITIHGGRNNNLYTFSEFHDAMEKVMYHE
jgi:alpha-beta hydrolase superfamily lysophospholipase